jgi:NIPSNAP
MRTFELRVYKLRSKETLDFYMNQIYPRHLGSFPLFGIEAHGFWTAKEDAEPRLFVLASYAAGEEPGEVARRYMQSKEFAEDTRNFDVSNIIGVESTILIPSASSPLK